VTFHNRVGEFAYSVPASWNARSCEEIRQGIVVAQDEPYICGGDWYPDAWLFAISVSGDQRHLMPPYNPAYFYLAGPRSETEVVVYGTVGHRYVAPLDRGWVETYYVFFSGFRTYAFVYYQRPTDPDRLADFDRSVQSELIFS